jgi:hypothetical protein
MVWFASSDPNACVALANLEYHTGPISQKLHSDMPGSDSSYLDEERLMTHPEAGMIAKCASMSWFPSHSWLDAHHLHLPGLSGQIISSGSLEDISQEHGAVTSLQVDSKSHSHLSATFGSEPQENLPQHIKCRRFEAHKHCCLAGALISTVTHQLLHPPVCMPVPWSVMKTISCCLTMLKAW